MAWVTAVVQDQSLARKLPYALDVATKEKKKKDFPRPQRVVHNPRPLFPTYHLLDQLQPIPTNTAKLISPNKMASTLLISKFNGII